MWVLFYEIGVNKKDEGSQIFNQERDILIYPTQGNKNRGSKGPLQLAQDLEW